MVQCQRRMNQGYRIGARKSRSPNEAFRHSVSSSNRVIRL